MKCWRPAGCHGSLKCLTSTLIPASRRLQPPAWRRCVRVMCVEGGMGGCAGDCTHTRSMTQTPTPCANYRCASRCTAVPSAATSAMQPNCSGWRSSYSRSSNGMRPGWQQRWRGTRAAWMRLGVRAGAMGEGRQAVARIWTGRSCNLCWLPCHAPGHGPSWRQVVMLSVYTCVVTDACITPALVFSSQVCQANQQPAIQDNGHAPLSSRRSILRIRSHATALPCAARSQRARCCPQRTAKPTDMIVCLTRCKSRTAHSQSSSSEQHETLSPPAAGTPGEVGG